MVFTSEPSAQISALGIAFVTSRLACSVASPTPQGRGDEVDRQLTILPVDENLKLGNSAAHDRTINPNPLLLFFGLALNQEEKSPETHKKSQSLCRVCQR